MPKTIKPTMKLTLKRFLEIHQLELNLQNMRYEGGGVSLEGGIVKYAERNNELDKLAIETTYFIKNQL